MMSIFSRPQEHLSDVTWGVFVYPLAPGSPQKSWHCKKAFKISKLPLKTENP